METVSSDKPIDHPNGDKFGYTPFAKHLAQSLINVRPSGGLVMAINGSWGSGKSTVIKFIEHYLDEIDSTHRPLVTRFNPWLFSGHDTLMLKYFAHLKQFLATKSDFKDLAEKIGDMAELSANIPFNPYAPFGKMAKKVLDLVSKKGSLEQVKNDIESALKKQPRPFLVVIDDVDRLSKEEIRELFRLIKSVANFPNVIYLLAFDKDIVCDSLSEIQSGKGEEYLEKIIQIPFDLPLPGQMQLRSLLNEKLGEVFGKIDEEIVDQTYLNNLYMEGVDPFIEKPRDIVRLINALSLTYPAVKGEVNEADFLVIETLRVFEPNLYDTIRKNPGHFCGTSRDNGRHTQEKDKVFHEQWLSTVNSGREELLKGILERVFPRTKSIWGNTFFGADWVEEWNRQLKVCSEIHFPTYFRLSPPSDGFSHSQMKFYIGGASSVDSFVTTLVEMHEQKLLYGKSKIRVFLERLEDYIAKLDESLIPNMLSAFMSVGDGVINSESEKSHMFEFSIQFNFMRVFNKLLRRIDDKEKRKDLIVGAIEENLESINLPVELIEFLSRQHGRLSEREPEHESLRLLTEEQVIQLEKVGTDIFQRNQDRLLNQKNLFSLLWSWKRFSGNEDAENWLQTQIATDEGLVKILSLALHYSLSQGFGDYTPKKRPRLNPKSLAPFVDYEQIVDRIRAINSDPPFELSEREQLAVSQFLKEYEKIQRGEDPSE